MARLSAVAHHAGGFGALDQLKDRSADGDRMTPGGMVDIHHLRLGAVNGKQVFVALDKLENAEAIASSWEQSLSRMGEPSTRRSSYRRGYRTSGSP